jgi:hypothetical protein
MRHQWQALLELVWPSRYDPIASHERRMAFLQAGIAMAIALAAGPEIFAAMEMTALLELLGAILFLTAMAAGAKLVALSIRSAICNIAFPVPPAAVVRSDASISAKALALIYLTTHATWCLAMALNCRCVGAVGHSAGRIGEWPPNKSPERAREE